MSVRYTERSEIRPPDQVDQYGLLREIEQKTVETVVRYDDPCPADLRCSVKALVSRPPSFLQAARRQPSTQQLIGLLVFMVTGPLLAMDYWHNGGGGTYLGCLPLSTLCIVAAVGGAISFPISVNVRARLLAVIPGVLAGFGAFGLHILYTGWLQKDMMHSGESLVVAGVGASPGVLICWTLMKWTGRTEKQDEP